MRSDAELGRGAQAALIVGRLTWLDFVRRKDLYVVMIFMLLFVGGTVVIRIVGIDKVSTARFLMSAGLALSHLLAAFLAASFSARCFPEEFERGTLMPLLAKPVSRGQVLGGKAGACLVLVLGSYVLFVGLTLLAVPLAPGQRLSVLGQTVALQGVGLALLCAMAMALSLYWPALVSALAALLWHFGAGFVVNLVRESVAMRCPALTASIERLRAGLPDAGLLSHGDAFVSGGAGPGVMLFAALAAYGLAWTAFFALWAWRRFSAMKL